MVGLLRGNVLLSQVISPPLFRPQGAGADILTKYVL